MNREEAERLLEELKRPEYIHWIRRVEIRQDLTGSYYISAYTDCLTSLRAAALDRVSQTYGVLWRAEPSHTERAIWIRLWERG